MKVPLCPDLRFICHQARVIAQGTSGFPAMAIISRPGAAGGCQFRTDRIVLVWALGVYMGIGLFGLSLYYKRPIIMSWSTRRSTISHQL